MPDIQHTGVQEGADSPNRLTDQLLSGNHTRGTQLAKYSNSPRIYSIPPRRIWVPVRDNGIKKTTIKNRTRNSCSEKVIMKGI